MLSKDFLTKQVPTLKIENSGSFALAQMKDYKLKHLPVVREGRYLYLLSEKELFRMDHIDHPIGSINLYAPSVSEKTPLPDVLRMMSNEQLSVLPVVDDDGIYTGAITPEILVEKMAYMTQSALHGALIALEINSQDYGLSHIVHLVESNNARILTLFTYPVDATSKLTVLLKIDLEDASPVLRSLERFNYKVLYYAQKKILEDDTTKRRLDELLYYLEM